ncbi:MAG TPA: hypothetical protein IAB59_03490 [Candidatus Onthousia faecipullorum]|uniref:Uncharacterized protein n=1 Tax=Candidatus Onthousia faecipullorum TaxID=2840887 RepID=A0A9D1KBU5_9FIRM|nr:hypothetical protein [Candidatus Onthousia faecipullorum]
MEVKRNNKHLGIIIFIGFLLIIIGIISYVVINYNSDQAEVKKRMDEVRESYKVFKTDVDAFNSIRDDIYNEVMQDMYYQMLKDNDARYKELYQSYSDSLEKIDKDYNGVKDKCINVLHPEADVNNKCEAIVSSYEEVVNIYVSDVNSYNSLIDSYNKWLSDNNSTDTKLDKIKLDRDYLDINGDREYNGRVDEDINISDEEDNTGVVPDE